MKIKYLKKVQDNPTIGMWTNEGLSLEEINELENKYNRGDSFPTAIREYLYLAGRFSNLALDHYGSFDKMQIEATDSLEMYQVNIERPYFVISQYDNCMQFTFIYLDDIEEDPKVYNCYVDYIEDGVEFITSTAKRRFVAMINAHVEVSLVDAKYYKSNNEEK